MPISGLVVTVDGCPSRVDSALTALRSDPRVTLGERVGPVQPIVTDTSDKDEDRSLRETLLKLDGIIKVDIIFVHFDEDGCTRPEPMASSNCSSFADSGGNRQSSNMHSEVESSC